MLEPVNDFILVDPVIDEKSAGGIILVAGEQSERPWKGKILKVGPGKYVDGVLEPMRMKVGQVVLFQQFPHFDFVDKGKRFIFVRELQVVAVVS
jgi:chaperonin GroES